jgi:hypothetical protein
VTILTLRNPHIGLAIPFVLTAIAVWQTSAWAGESKPAPELSITAISDHEVELAWSKYKRPLALERKLPNQNIFTQIAIFEPETHQYTDHNLPANVGITYRLKSIDSRNLDEYGPSKTVEISLPPPPPPSLTRIGIGTVKIGMEIPSRWARYITIQRKVGGTYKTTADIPNDSSYIDDHLATGSYEYYRILYRGEKNTSPPSPLDSIFLDFQPPGAFSYKLINDHTVQLSWRNAMQFPCSYQIEKKSPQGIEIVDIPDADSVWIDNHMPYQTYAYYRIRSKADGNHSNYSRPVTVYIVLSAITGLTADPIHDLVVHLNWSNPKDLASDYVLERSIDDEVFLPLAHLEGHILTYTDSLPQRGLQLRYRIAGVIEQGDRIYSNEASEYIPSLYAGMTYVATADSTPGFYMDACEATVEQYRDFCAATHRDLPSDPGFSDYPDYWQSSQQFPAVNVSWKDAIEYCNWRSTQLGLQAAYDDNGNMVDAGSGFRLLTTKMYLSALQQADQSDANFLGIEDDWSDVRRCASSAEDSRAIRNLLGNVWEWTEDSTESGARMILGGSYTTPKDMVSGIPGFSYLPDWKSPSIGFRCALLHIEAMEPVSNSTMTVKDPR